MIGPEEKEGKWSVKGDPTKARLSWPPKRQDYSGRDEARKRGSRKSLLLERKRDELFTRQRRKRWHSSRAPEVILEKCTICWVTANPRPSIKRRETGTRANEEMADGAPGDSLACREMPEGLFALRDSREPACFWTRRMIIRRDEAIEAVGSAKKVVSARDDNGDHKFTAVAIAERSASRAGRQVLVGSEWRAFRTKSSKM